jgi:CDP-glycerol glycerophosphotransferase
MTSWSKLLRREFLASLDVRFAAGIHEDVPVTCAALLAARSIAAVGQVCYRYRQDRRGSAMATTGAGHLAIFDSYREAFDLVTSRNAAGAPASEAVRAALFARAMWHYAAILDAGLVPADERRRYFARMHAEFAARRPAGYRHPPGARGLKFRLIERGWYPAYAALTPVNRLRVAAARRLGGRPAGPEPAA